MTLDRHAVPGIELYFDPSGGRIDSIAINRDGTTLTPLHKAPWVASGEVLPDSVAPVETRLAGDFFCAPFSSRPGMPIHGWSANGTWVADATASDPEGAITATYRLKEDIFGARLTKRLTLRPGHPFVYQSHHIAGGHGHLPIGHHAMIHVPGGVRLSFSKKRFGVAPNVPVETDPERGRSSLSYPQRFTSLSQVLTADGRNVDARSYPFDSGHEDIVTLAEAGGSLGWSAALAIRDGFLFFAIKDARRLPETILWMSNGGRHYAPWLGRHTNVLGIEEVATSCHASGHFDSASGQSEEGLTMGLELGDDDADIRYGFGAIAAPPGWTEVADIQPFKSILVLRDIGGDAITLPFDGTHFGL